MATSGAFNGTDVFLRVKSGASWVVLGGQISHTETLNTAVIDITNKIGTPKFREILGGEGTQSIDYSVELLFVDQAGYNFVRTLAGNKGQALFQTVRGDIANGGVVVTELILQVSQFVDSSGDGEALKGTISMLSSDAFDHDANISFSRLLVSNGDNFITSNGDNYFVRT